MPRLVTGIGAAAPPPAPATHPWRDAIVVATFGLAIAAAGIGAIVNRDLVTTVFEKRTTAPWPAPADLRAAGMKAWSKAFEAAFDDRFGGRDRLIARHHRVLVLDLGVSPVPKVMVGRDGWLFFKGEDTLAIDRDFRGVVPYPAMQAQAIARELERRHAALAQRGIAYIAVAVPDKATIYPEHLPAWVQRAPVTRLDRLYAATTAYPGLQLLDLRPDLVRAKPGRQLYFRTDSHWNYEGGGVVGYDALMRAVTRDVASAPHVPAEATVHDPGDRYSGDLAVLLGLPEALAEDDLYPFGKILADPSRRCARTVQDDAEPLVYTCARAGLPRAIVYRDSMMDLMIPSLAENFGRVVFHSGHAMKLTEIDAERPDIVIDEFVERTMHVFLSQPLQ